MRSVRRPAVAGSFYPRDPATLAALVDGLLGNAAVPFAAGAGAPKAIIVPHAGYAYSGAVAALAYASVAGIAAHVRRVVVVGPCHRVFVRCIAVPGASAFATPLGDVEVDAEMVHVAERAAKTEVSNHAHADEHSIEVQLPFLQRLLGDFRLVPIGVGLASARVVARALDALWGGPETLVVISSDLSHYLPYEAARDTDGMTAQRVLALSDSAVGHDEACGAIGINALITVARRRRLAPRLLGLRSSGDTAGPRHGVVGYGAFVFEEALRG
jgi:AmmeMemoRadiSam system protein B